MIEFNLQRALDGVPLICRDGSLVLKWMRPLDGNSDAFPIAAQIEKKDGEITTETYNKEGNIYNNTNKHPLDLMLDINEQQV